ncbi:MAG: bifunctional tetrahydrofolate synthase/dihydrofolate synthase [SAR86 cluster bacterium]|uniref:Dihydrofolate synthase/folylpolyglutamate synthase n=1 Tax=SAR86 cluster bacterium TaxID=2030880 RepID=A0A2A5BB21_9GAMM|nr:MAG: bifunctional tetrahydrofolate synthase/dihydrofolate synthase [SAR86 cluster bacterium]
MVATSRSTTRSIEQWLEYISSVHPREIELGLERTRRVADKLQIGKIAPLVITVAGTNGKGSCVASMEAILQHAGYKTAAYTSPHIHCFNERIRVESAAVNDETLINAFADIDRCRGDDSLSYFEFATLAALHIFNKAQLDIVLLEVGLGGRLDAVNIIDPDVAVISNISIDHEDWLGSGIENIAAEKAGILRENTPVVYGELSVPDNITRKADELNSPLYRLGRDFGFSIEPDSGCWTWNGVDASQGVIQFKDLTRPNLALVNVSVALQALALLPIELSLQGVNEALKGLLLPGRFELRQDCKTSTSLIFDVAHNAAATELLAENLRQYKKENPKIQRVIMVLAVMADKDIEAMISSLESCFDFWYIAQVEVARCMPAQEVTQRINSSCKGLNLLQFDSVIDAYHAACEQATEQDVVVVTGSFFTVAAVRELSLPV